MSEIWRAATNLKFECPLCHRFILAQEFEAHRMKEIETEKKEAP
jgi:hypothetical protein